MTNQQAAQQTNIIIQGQGSCFISPVIADVYGVRRISTGRLYIGSTNNIERRIYEHFNDLKNGNHDCPELQHDYNLNPADFDYVLLDKVYLGEKPEDIENHQIKRHGGLSFGNVYNSNKPIASKISNAERYFEDYFQPIFDEYIKNNPEKAMGELIAGLNKAQMAKTQPAIVPSTPVQTPVQSPVQTIPQQPTQEAESKPKTRFRAKTFVDQLKLEQTYINQMRASNDVPEFVIIADEHLNGTSWEELAKRLQPGVDIDLGKKRVQAQWDTLQDTFPAYYIDNGGGIRQGKRIKRCVTNLNNIGIYDIPGIV